MDVVPLDASSNGNVPISPHFHKLAKAINCLNNKTDISNNRFGTKMHTESLLGGKGIFSWITNTEYSICRGKDTLMSKLSYFSALSQIFCMTLDKRAEDFVLPCVVV